MLHHLVLLPFFSQVVKQLILCLKFLLTDLHTTHYAIYPSKANEQLSFMSLILSFGMKPWCSTNIVTKLWIELYKTFVIVTGFLEVSLLFLVVTFNKFSL